MTRIVISPKQYSKLMGRLSSEYIPSVRRGILSGALRSLPELFRRTREAPPANPGGKGSGGAVNNGVFLRSWDAKRTPEGALIQNTAPYAAIVEYGRRPGRKMPPSRPIALWAQRRLGLDEKTSKRVAFLIARAIGKRGLVGRHILEKAIPTLVGFMEEEIAREIKVVLGKIG